MAVCVDLSANLLKVSRRYIKTYAPGMRVLHMQGDITDLQQIPSRFCDVTVVQSVLEYLDDLKSARKAVSELQRITRGGIYIFDLRDGSKTRYNMLRGKAGLVHANTHLFIPRTFWGSDWRVIEPSRLMKTWSYIGPFAYHVTRQSR